MAHRTTAELLADLRWAAGRLEDAIAFFGDGRPHTLDYAVDVMAEVSEHLRRALALVVDDAGAHGRAVVEEGIEEFTFDRRTGTLYLDRSPSPRETIAAVRAQLRKPCPHGIPKSDPCAACAQEVPF